MPDKSENRERVVNLVKDWDKFLGDDDHGNWWYAEILSNGSQLWGEVRGDKIINCGLNETPKPYHPKTGLCDFDPDKQKK